MVGNFASAGRQTNPAANTILADTGVINTEGGLIGGSYKFGFFFTSSTQMTHKIESLDGSGNIVNTIYVEVQANDSKLLAMDIPFLIVNGYSVRVRNDSGPGLGSTSQVCILWQLVEIE